MTGGSTNATIHLIAMARSAGVDFRLEDFRRISAETPFISDLKPSGKCVLELGVGLANPNASSSRPG